MPLDESIILSVESAVLYLNVGVTGYVHIMREGGKPVVLLLDVFLLFLRVR
jgi:hypothetical protein